MNYVYCPKCKTVQEMVIKKAAFSGKEIICCGKCGKAIKSTLIQRKCETCGNVLFAPHDQQGLKMPCEAAHEEDRKQWEAANKKENERQQENRINFSMREIPCKHCHTVLRLNDGRFERCSNCNEVPDPDYIKKCWKKLTNQEPGWIQWDDPKGEKLLHVDQRRDIPPHSILKVAHGQHAVYDDSYGGRRVLSPGAYALVNSTSRDSSVEGAGNAELLLGPGTRIVFFRENSTEIPCEVSFEFSGGKWEVVIPVRIPIKLNQYDVERLMGFNMDLTDDKWATETLKMLVQEEVHEKIYRLVLTKETEGSLYEVQGEHGMERWFLQLLSDDVCLQISQEVNDVLSRRYGIELSNALTFRVSNIAVYHMPGLQEVVCTYREKEGGPQCGHKNYIPLADYQARKSFICEKCGHELAWCPNCKGYVTRLKRYRFCDQCGGSIY